VSGDRPWGRAPISAPVTGRPGPAKLGAGGLVSDGPDLGERPAGWALVAAPCVRRLCLRVAATGGRRAHLDGTAGPPGIIEDESGAVSCAPVACVGQIRFAAAKVGYLFGPALFQTDEGGRTWRRVPTARWRPSNRWRARWSGWCMTTLAALARAPGRCRKPLPGRTLAQPQSLFPIASTRCLGRS